MIDPYQTPQSDVQVIEQNSKTKWKVFLWVIATLEVISVAILVTDPNESALDVFVDLVIYTTIILGVFGYAYNKRIFFKKFWTFVIPVGIAYDIYGLYTWNWTFESTEELYLTIGITAAIALPIMFFQYLALFRYGFKSQELW